MALAQKLLPLADRLRALPGRFGLRPYTVTIRLRLWNGERPGLGSYSDFDTPIVNTVTLPFGKKQSQPPKVEQLSAKDVIASGGLYTDRDFRVGPMTPSYGPGGVNRDIIDPKVYNAAAEVFWIMTGPDLPATGEVFRRTSEEATALHFYVTLRATGKTP